MKRVLIILVSFVCIISCNKGETTPESTKGLQNGTISVTENDSLFKYILHFAHAPRDVDYLWAMTGSCLPSAEFKDGFILDASSSFGNKYSYEEFAISIQTSNTPLDYKLNTFNGKPACFKFGEYSWTALDYLDSGNEVYSKVLDSVKRKIAVNPDPTNGPNGYAPEPAVFYEYRNDVVDDIVITSNVPMFNRGAGENLSDKFDIVLFYMNAMGQPAYMISSENGTVDYMVSKGTINHKGDNNMNSFVGNSYELAGNLYKTDTSKGINLKEWVKGKYYVDPALYVQFNEKPLSESCNVKFTVTLSTGTKKLTAETPVITLY